MEASLLGELMSNYDFEDNNIQFKKFGSGHIHHTYKMETAGKAFILQEFNDQVFKFPDRISFNLQLLLQEFSPGSLPFELPLPLKNNKDEFFTFFNGALYRIFPFVPGSTKDAVEKKFQAKIAAEAFAAFIKVFIAVEAKKLKEPISDFHNLETRFYQFETSIAASKIEIDPETSRMIEFYKEQKTLLEQYRHYVGDLELRVTHNDTKINNLIFNESLDQVNALIDLDTIMPGYVFYDFGDLVRTVACTEDESSVNWGQIQVDLDKYEGLLEGFLLTLMPVLPEKELASLTFGGEMMTLIMGLRFLTDHLNGNIYYQVNYAAQNLHRSRNQSELLSALIRERTALDQMVKKIKSNSINQNGK